MNRTNDRYDNHRNFALLFKIRELYEAMKMKESQNSTSKQTSVKT